MRTCRTAIVLALLGSSAGVSAAQQADLRSILTAPIAIERSSPVTILPLARRGGTLVLDAIANGQSREFIFDTGLPTILTREFSDRLGVRIVGQNTGVDANGARVTMDVAVLDSLTLGALTFREVPVFVFDYRLLPTGACIVDGGILGSELLPGSAWRIDTESGELTIAGSAGAMNPGALGPDSLRAGADRQAAPPVQARLFDLGYPHAPIIDYTVGDVSDKAMFDTGNADAVTLFSRVADNATVQSSFVPGSMSRGRGSEGESAGGRGGDTELMRVTVNEFTIDGQPMGPMRTTTRGVPPSLVGRGVLRTHIVTLDYPGARIVFEPRTTPEPSVPEAGYSLAAHGDAATVVRLFHDSAAARAGLTLADRVVAAQGHSLRRAADEPACNVTNWLLESFDPAAAATLVIERNGERLTLQIPASRP